MKPDSLIHLRVTAATKGRWVRASRAAGMRLSDWIAGTVEHGGEAKPVADDLIAKASGPPTNCPLFNHSDGAAESGPSTNCGAGISTPAREIEAGRL